MADLRMQFGIQWDLIKTPLIVPLLQLAVYICLAMTLMLFIERLYMGVVIILIKLFWKKPEQRYKWQPIDEDTESGNSSFPMVLIQIPMFNEKEVQFMFLNPTSFSCSKKLKRPNPFQVYNISIGATFNLS